MRLAAALSVLFAALGLFSLWGSDPKLGGATLTKTEESRPSQEQRVDRATSESIAVEVPATEPPDTWIEVRVLDTRGEPLPEVDVLRSSAWGLVLVESEKQRTDALGVCRFGIGSTHREHALAGRRFSVAVEQPLGNTVERDFDPRTPPQETIELRVEDGGRLELIACDELDVPHVGAVKFRLRDLESSSRRSPPSWFENSSVSADQGRATSPSVALGRRWRIDVETVDRTHASGFVITEGPSAVGETKTVRVPLGRQRPVLTARFVDEQGQPLREAQLGAELRSGKQLLGVDTFRTDARLPVRWPLDLRALRASKLELHVWSPRVSPTRIRTIAVPTPITSATIDLGDVVCAEIPIRVSGIVVDANDQPLPGADIGCFWKRLEPEEPVQLIATRTDAEGRFALRVPAHDSPRVLQAKLTDFSFATVDPIFAGSAEALSLRIVMRRAGSVVGRVLLADDAGAQQWKLGLFEADRGEPRWVKSMKFAAPEDRLLLEPVRAGTYILRFGTNAAVIAGENQDASDHSWLLEIPNVVVPEGGACRDPRLSSIDLREKLTQREVRVRNAEGQSRSHLPAVFALRTSDGVLRSLRGHSSDEHGSFRILAPPNLLALQIAVPGHRSATLDPRVSVQEVRLERGIPVRIELGPDAPELPTGFQYALRLSREDANDEWTAGFGSYDRRGFWARAVGGGYECDLPAAGRY
ncbi:MAG: carboxypeptidase regulatory-like domain-containing protein, partial [Planctomycetes bacterium]|nr:carboxypeptidase regulatory-like domain-containing protein [Planctomycetota bacterium]